MRTEPKSQRGHCLLSFASLVVISMIWPYCALAEGTSNSDFLPQTPEKPRPSREIDASGGFRKEKVPSFRNGGGWTYDLPPTWETCSIVSNSAVPFGWCKEGSFFGIAELTGLGVLSWVNDAYYGLVQTALWATHRKMYSVGQVGALLSNSGYAFRGGFQIGGLVAWANDFKGVAQVAGFQNYAGDFLGLAQIALFNKSERFAGGACAGVVNVSVDFRGLLSLGIVNWADDFAGSQIGVVNRAKTMKGVQIGAFNTAETIQGVQIGVVNHAANGVLPYMVLINGGL